MLRSIRQAAKRIPFVEKLQQVMRPPPTLLQAPVALGALDLTTLDLASFPPPVLPPPAVVGTVTNESVKVEKKIVTGIAVGTPREVETPPDAETSPEAVISAEPLAAFVGCVLGDTVDLMQTSSSAEPETRVRTPDVKVPPLSLQPKKLL